MLGQLDTHRHIARYIHTYTLGSILTYSIKKNFACVYLIIQSIYESKSTFPTFGLNIAPYFCINILNCIIIFDLDLSIRKHYLQVIIAEWNFLNTETVLTNIFDMLAKRGYFVGPLLQYQSDDYRWLAFRLPKTVEIFSNKINTTHSVPNRVRVRVRSRVRVRLRVRVRVSVVLTKKKLFSREKKIRLEWLPLSR